MTAPAATLTITEFLLARIADDEAVATALIDEGPWNDVHRTDRNGPTRDDEYSGLNIGAGRVLAECAAKRKIVDDLDIRLCGPCQRAERCVNHDSSAGGPGVERLFDWASDRIARTLAAVYADHPDYRDEWRA